MIVAANFKTHQTRKGTFHYLAVLEDFLLHEEIHQQAIVFPPATALEHHDGHVLVGTQNAYPAQNGAFTGEIGLEQLEEFDIHTILIGHSERRHLLGETQESIASKFAFFKEQHFNIVYCIGEPLDVREAGEDALMAYLQTQLEGIDLNYERLTVAYEPVWAIGTGVTPSLEAIERTHVALKGLINTPLLYGGSVKRDNAEEIMALNAVDGILVGSGALDVDDFCAMLKTAQHLEEGE